MMMINRSSVTRRGLKVRKFEIELSGTSQITFDFQIDSFFTLEVNVTKRKKYVRVTSVLRIIFSTL